MRTGSARNARLDILSADQLGYALYAPAFLNPSRPVNLARFVFLDQRATEFYRDWNRIADDAVGSLRAEAARVPTKATTDLVGELATRSHQLSTRWAAHDVRYYRSGTPPFHHTLIGDVDLDYDALELPAAPGQTIITYSAADGTEAREALERLGRWTTAPDNAQTLASS